MGEGVPETPPPVELSWTQLGTESPPQPGTESPPQPGTESPSQPRPDSPPQPRPDGPPQPGPDGPPQPGTESPSQPGREGPPRDGPPQCGPDSPGRDGPLQRGPDSPPHEVTPESKSQANVANADASDSNPRALKPQSNQDMTSSAGASVRHVYVANLLSQLGEGRITNEEVQRRLHDMHVAEGSREGHIRTQWLLEWVQENKQRTSKLPSFSLRQSSGQLGPAQPLASRIHEAARTNTVSTTSAADSTKPSLQSSALTPAAEEVLQAPPHPLLTKRRQHSTQHVRRGKPTKLSSLEHVDERELKVQMALKKHEEMVQANHYVFDIKATMNEVASALPGRARSALFSSINFGELGLTKTEQLPQEKSSTAAEGLFASQAFDKKLNAVVFIQRAYRRWVVEKHKIKLRKRMIANGWKEEVVVVEEAPPAPVCRAMPEQVTRTYSSVTSRFMQQVGSPKVSGRRSPGAQRASADAIREPPAPDRGGLLVPSQGSGPRSSPPQMLMPGLSTLFVEAEGEEGVEEALQSVHSAYSMLQSNQVPGQHPSPPASGSQPPTHITPSQLSQAACASISQPSSINAGGLATQDVSAESYISDLVSMRRSSDSGMACKALAAVLSTHMRGSHDGSRHVELVSYSRPSLPLKPIVDPSKETTRVFPKAIGRNSLDSAILQGQSSTPSRGSQEVASPFRPASTLAHLRRSVNSIKRPSTNDPMFLKAYQRQQLMVTQVTSTSLRRRYESDLLLLTAQASREGEAPAELAWQDAGLSDATSSGRGSVDGRERTLSASSQISPQLDILNPSTCKGLSLDGRGRMSPGPLGPQSKPSSSFDQGRRGSMDGRERTINPASSTTSKPGSLSLQGKQGRVQGSEKMQSREAQVPSWGESISSKGEASPKRIASRQVATVTPFQVHLQMKRTALSNNGATETRQSSSQASPLPLHHINPSGRPIFSDLGSGGPLCSQADPHFSHSNSIGTHLDDNSTAGILLPSIWESGAITASQREPTGVTGSRASPIVLAGSTHSFNRSSSMRLRSNCNGGRACLEAVSRSSFNGRAPNMPDVPLPPRTKPPPISPPHPPRQQQLHRQLSILNGSRGKEVEEKEVMMGWGYAEDWQDDEDSLHWERSSAPALLRPQPPNTSQTSSNPRKQSIRG